MTRIARLRVVLALMPSAWVWETAALLAALAWLAERITTP